MFLYSRTFTIEWGDCDPAGIVYYPRYFDMFNGATSALFTTVLGMNLRALHDHFGIIGFPMVATEARFAIPSRFGDEVTIQTRATGFGRSSFGIAHSLVRADGGIAIEATEKRVWTAIHPDDADRMIGIALPDIVRLALENGPAS